MISPASTTVATSHRIRVQWRVGNAAHAATIYGSAGAGMYARFWAVEVYA